jgi:hypothetical protein
MKLFEDDRQTLASIQDKEQLNYSISKHMEKIKEHSDSKKIMKFFQLLSQYSVKHCGMSWRRYNYWAQDMKVSRSTIQRWVRLLAKLNIIIVFPTYRKNNRGQASNTICILPVIKSIVSRVCTGVCTPVKPSVNPLKQESNIYTDIQLNDVQYEQKSKLMHLAELKINDLLKAEKGSLINYASSYLNKVFKTAINQGLYIANEKEKEKMNKRKEASSRLFEEVHGKNGLPFYNWLDA